MVNADNKDNKVVISIGIAFALLIISLIVLLNLGS